MSQKILVVDDELDLVKLIASRLRANRYDVVTACDGKTCLDLALRERPHLIILDIVMPGMDGLAVLHELRTTAQTSAIPVIMLTQKGGCNSILDAQQLGATDYLSKPFKPEMLLKVINRYI